MEVYLGGKVGSPCCRVLTVSNECINMSPHVPPVPPANIAYNFKSGQSLGNDMMPLGAIVHVSMAAEVPRPPTARGRHFEQ